MTNVFESLDFLDTASLLADLLARPLPRTIGPAYIDEIGDPAPSQRRQCYLGITAAGRALAFPEPIDAIEDAMADLPDGRRRVDRDKALMYATTILLRLPARTRTVDDEVRTAVARLDQFGASLQIKNRPRLVVATPSGARWFVEAHPATHAGGTADGWMSRRIAAHLEVGDQLPNFAGVAVLTARSPHLSVHVNRAGSHLLGACSLCQEVAR